MLPKKVYIADEIFTGEEWLKGYGVITVDGKIIELVKANEIPVSLPVERFENAILVPAFIDLQIYGAYGKLLSVYPEADSLYKLNEYCRSGGAAWCMPTVATNTYEVFHQCIDAVREYWKMGGQGVLGLHLEGPWINPVRRGAHIESLIHTPSAEEVKALLEYGKDVIRIITLAPEVCGPSLMSYIASQGIIISAGHSNATYTEAKQGFSNGATTVTHLYNAMSPLQHRAPGLVGAAMDDDTVMASIIPDGYHVDYAAVRIAKQVMKDRLFVITDAVTETDKGAYPHQFAGDKYEASGILSGSALTMSKAVQRLTSFACVELGEALRMCSLYPAKVMRMEDRLGKIKKGYDAKMAVLNKDLEVEKVLD
ncbi:MAG TPA: N-acetylglucosamine-6-phosphate deacetylase [Chitinophagaceae bacterium]|nr:N-acetylglucosamine-6-phosphate deacetylase [Chitinophagaceae bacterium]